MSRKYKFHNPEGMYFVSCATVVHWIDVFVREVYCDELVNSLRYCIKEKGLLLYAWCIMPSHVHFIFKSGNNEAQKLLQEFKRFTAKSLLSAIRSNPQESRMEWILWMMARSGKKLGQDYQFWQQHNKPIELWSAEVIDQKVDYIHCNPVESGFVQLRTLVTNQRQQGIRRNCSCFTRKKIVYLYTWQGIKISLIVV